MKLQNKTAKLIPIILIISILLPNVLFSLPKKVTAQDAPGTTAAMSVPVADIPAETSGFLSRLLHVVTSGSTVTNTSLHIKDFAQFLLRQILMRVAKAFLAKMTQATINWINSDFHGSPLFLENPESFFRDIAKSEIRNLVDMIGYDTFRFPFGKQTALNVITSYKRQLADNAQYTLSKVINDPDLLVRYRNDFNYGGWNGFLINTQYPQNNYLGFQMIIQQNLASRLEGTLVAPAQKIQNLLQQGMGFLSPQTCPTNPKYNNGINEFQRPSFQSKVVFTPPTYDPNDGGDNVAREREARMRYQDSKDIERVAWTDQNTCPGGLVNTTPGSVAANQIMTAMSSSYRQSELAAALGNSLSAIFDALINHFLDKGLNALSGAVSGGSSSEDNWSYDGQTLGGSTTPYGAPTNLNIPQNVSVVVGETTNTIISGGTAPYSIQTQPNTRIATAQISYSGSSNPTLTVRGITPGNTFVVVRDSSTPVKTVSVAIAINTLGTLVVNPRNILIDVNNSMSATISGGEKPYFMQTGPDETKAVVVFSDTNLVIIGVAAGQTMVTVRDSSIPVKFVTVPITISGAVDFTIPNVTANVGQVINTTISGGTAPYLIENQLNPAVATAQISGATLITRGILAGQTTVIVKDSSTPAKATSVNITINATSPTN